MPYTEYTEAEFLDVSGTKVLRIFLLAIHSLTRHLWFEWWGIIEHIRFILAAVLQPRLKLSSVSSSWNAGRYSSPFATSIMSSVCNVYTPSCKCFGSGSGSGFKRIADPDPEWQYGFGSGPRQAKIGFFGYLKKSKTLESGPGSGWFGSSNSLYLDPDSAKCLDPGLNESGS